MCAGVEFKKMVFFKVHSKINYDNNLGLFTTFVVNNSLLQYLFKLIEFMNFTESIIKLII